jgi:7,8-dihydroneopterin aldolase/epimerase/oxygenase
MAMQAELDTITLEGMSFHVCIGVLPHEREIPQPLEVDLTSWVRRDAGVVDYRALYEAVRAATAAPGLGYLEELAESIAAAVLAHQGVFRVKVVVRKPHAAVGGPLRHAEVALTRQRDA